MLYMVSKKRDESLSLAILLRSCELQSNWKVQRIHEIVLICCYFDCLGSDMPVRGIYLWCQGCNHGGHIDHMKAWFSHSIVCPTGCGHRCVASTKNVEKFNTEQGKKPKIINSE